MTSLSADLTTMALLQALAGLNMNEPLEHRSILDMTHTPTPWKIAEYGAVNGPDGDYVKVKGMALTGTAEAVANSAFIVTAVNAFEANQARIAELTEALERQTENMAFVLNRVDLHGFHGKFEREVAEDRALLAALSPQP